MTLDDTKIGADNMAPTEWSRFWEFLFEIGMNHVEVGTFVGNNQTVLRSHDEKSQLYLDYSKTKQVQCT